MFCKRGFGWPAFRRAQLIRNRDPPVGPSKAHRHSQTVGSWGCVVSEERGTPVREGVSSHRIPSPFGVVTGCFRALTSRLIFLAGVNWSCLRINEPAFSHCAGCGRHARLASGSALGALLHNYNYYYYYDYCQIYLLPIILRCWIPCAGGRRLARRASDMKCTHITVRTSE